MEAKLFGTLPNLFDTDPNPDNDPDKSIVLVNNYKLVFSVRCLPRLPAALPSVVSVVACHSVF